jgi:hypothetical protein
MAPRATHTASDDHDLLIEIKAQLGFTQNSLSEMRTALTAALAEARTALSARIDALGREKANVTDLDPLRGFIEGVQTSTKERTTELDGRIAKQEEKVGSISKTVWVGVGIITAVQVFVVPLIISAAVYWITHAK